MKKIIMIAIFVTISNADVEPSNVDKFKAASVELWKATKGIALDLKSEYIDDNNETNSSNTHEVEEVKKKVILGVGNTGDNSSNQLDEKDDDFFSWAKLKRYIKMEGEFKED